VTEYGGFCFNQAKGKKCMDDLKGREFQIAAEVADLLDQLPPEKQKQVMAILASRYNLKLTDPPTTSGKGYRPSPKRGRW
jgi:hypothetical protein